MGNGTAGPATTMACGTATVVATGISASSTATADASACAGGGGGGEACATGWGEWAPPGGPAGRFFRRATTHPQHNSMEERPRRTTMAMVNWTEAWTPLTSCSIVLPSQPP